MHMPPYQVIVQFLLVAFIAAISGCSSFRDPIVTLVDASLTETSESAFGIGLHLDLTNSNSEPVELYEFTYAITINGTGAYSGRWAASATLPANGSRQLLIPAVVLYDQMGWTEDSLPEEARFDVTGTLLYIAPGDIAEILFDTGVRKPTVSFSGHGILKLDKTSD